ncbi:MAG: type I-U CRISPR-associated protein Cas5/Cas6 [Rhodobacteraceae bacterium]|nr:MAG: type I-U CRISPR-associated protein Cas5/Cas6 [Paracoccaceae bacterium]
MSLVLDIEFLTGVCRAARGPADPTPDWPPQPDRVFSALVASWAGRGEKTGERAALEWLERQAPPLVQASAAAARTTVEVFVPPNDQRASSAAKTYLKIMPERRPRQPRRFPITRPDSPSIAFVWSDEPDAGTLAALDALARDVPYLGHSSSLVRCRFRLGVAARDAQPARRRVYPGRLRELERAHAAKPVRPMISPGAAVAPAAPTTPVSPLDWLVLEIVGGDAPDIRAAPILCRGLRRSIMAGYDRIGSAGAIPSAISGHEADGAPTTDDHVALVPMSFAGFPHADGRLMGFALVPPRGAALDALPGFVEAFGAVAPFDPALERRVLTLAASKGLAPLRLAPAEAIRPRSLSPAPYTAEAQVWASVTPMVLDRHLKRHDDAEIRALVAEACSRAGLPRPDPDRIAVGKHTAVEGAAPASPPARGPGWLRWRTPPALATRWLTHAVIDFGTPVAGPVLLGAGRFHGLGLFRGLDR